jgi:hypothetical protein
MLLIRELETQIIDGPNPPLSTSPAGGSGLIAAHCLRGSRNAVEAYNYNQNPNRNVVTTEFQMNTDLMP